MALHLDRSRSDALCAWLTANGIEPNTVPTDGDLTIVDTDDGRAIRCEVMSRTGDGRLTLDDRGDWPAREIRTVPLAVEPPKWWTPYEKPTREQLLAAVAELAQAIRLTREYVGADLLPAVDGWSWYDALRRHAPHELPASERPKEEPGA